MIHENVMNLEVFRKAYQLSLEIHRRTLQFPRFEQFETAAQMRRSSKSVCANLVEGLGKNQSPKEKARFIAISIGSNDETRMWLVYSKDLGYLNPNEYESLERRYGEVGRMLYGLKRSILKPPA